MKVQSFHLLTWGSVGVILFATPAIANAKDTSNFKNRKILPFVGAGIGGTTCDDGSIGLTITDGVDYRASNKITANGSVIWLPFDDDRVDFIVGLGYNF